MNYPSEGKPLSGISPDEAKLKFSEGTARMVWGVAALAQTITLLGCISYFLVVHYQVLRKLTDVKTSARFLLYLMLFLLLIGFNIGMNRFYTSSSGLGNYTAYFASGFLTKAIQSAQIPWIAKYIDIFTGLMVIMGLAGSFAVSLVLYYAVSTTCNSSAAEHERITFGVSSLRALLNASALALIVGVIQIDFEYRWASTLLLENLEKKLSDLGGSMAASITLACGGSLSLLLASVFVPAGIVLHKRTREFNMQNKRSTDPKNEISFDWRSMVADAFKIIGPALVAGPLAALVR